MCDDRAGHHSLWVTRAGEVRGTRIPYRELAAYEASPHPDLQMAYETFRVGNGYVGEEAAAEDESATDLFASMVREWPLARGKPEIRRPDIESVRVYD